MAKLFGVHQVELKPGVTAEEFEKFVKEEWSSFDFRPGWNLHHLKGIRGERDGQYLILAEVESVETRDKYLTADGKDSEEAKQFLEAHPENAKWFEKFHSLASDFNDTYTDYVELD